MAAGARHVPRPARAGGHDTDRRRWLRCCRRPAHHPGRPRRIRKCRLVRLEAESAGKFDCLSCPPGVEDVGHSSPGLPPAHSSSSTASESPTCAPRQCPNRRRPPGRRRKVGGGPWSRRRTARRPAPIRGASSGWAGQSPIDLARHSQRLGVTGAGGGQNERSRRPV